MQLFLNGEWNGLSDTAEVVNPYDGSVIDTVPCAAPAEITSAIDGLARGAQAMRNMPAHQRVGILRKAASLMRERQEKLGRLISTEEGKVLAEGHIEAGRAAETIDLSADEARALHGETVPLDSTPGGVGKLGFTLRVPCGIFAVNMPLNFPMSLVAHKVGPAIAAGNAVLLKPASDTPLSALKLVEILLEAGLPAEAIACITGPGAALGQAICTDPRVRKISFTGSTEVGSKIMKLAADDIKRVSLELGGKSPNIVFAEADWQRAATESPMSVFANTGQDCCARSRMFIEQPIFNDFVNQFVAATESLKIGDPTNDETQLGPMVSAAQREISESFVTEARDAGRDIRTGGERQGEHGFYLNPAVITGVKTGDRAWCEEIFGPVVCLRPFTDEAKMLLEVNDTSFGLSGSIWSRDLSRALRVARRVESGVISINTHSSVHTEAPFGGFKRSGLGRDLGMSAMEACTEVKNIYIGE